MEKSGFRGGGVSTSYPGNSGGPTSMANSGKRIGTTSGSG